ncbi:alpha/beta fold hydrolase [Ruania zhangjianzhongii]|uniref:alpha/beta fold hydrolase n=1 Tax=Ruania zhangjianzhongii TaxID=2603206 RepID=UPI00143CD2DD|nr:alpha/beta hydrolase [Ruania zhangjianzhongii]
MPTLKVNDTTIAYETSGDGPPLVFAHGLGLSREMWRGQIEHFSATNRVIAFDARGAGESGQLARGEDVLPRQAADLESLLDQLDVSRAVLCGVSYGGVLAQEFATTSADRLAGLVIVDSFPDSRLANPMQRIGLRVSAALAGPMLLLPPALMLPAVRQAYAQWPLAREVVTDGYATMRRVETARVRRAINRADYVPRLAQVSVPTRGIVGDTSPVLVELMHRLIDAVPNASLDVVPESFDPTNLCQPERFNALLEGFLAELGWTAHS